MPVLTKEFESSVNSEYSKTPASVRRYRLKFESSVNSEYSKTEVLNARRTLEFESSVNSEYSKTAFEALQAVH